MTEHTLSPELLRKMDAYWRAANYLSVGQIYLYDNPLLKEPLTPAPVKPMLLGHWGTTPGQNFIYVHLNRVIKKYDLDMIYVSGPGHAGSAVVGNTYLEGTYSEVYPNITRDEAGLKKLFTQFSFPGGIPSHASPECPGSMHEGGELGYSLSHSFGAVFDNLDRVVACVVGDGEAETGPLATAWHSNKFLNPATDGAVLPILHLNGYKISNPTLLARISREELEQFLRGCGWTPLFVEGHEPHLMHEIMAATLDRAVEQIRQIQQDARVHGELARPRWPMIVFDSPKGWTGPKVIATRALAALHKHGVSVKILTGDNHLVSRKVCKDVGLSADPMLLGGDIEKMSDAEPTEAAEGATLFARLSPAHKERVIRILRGNRHVVGFLGDGINDAPALRAADVGISVDTATDIAKESADLILLEKDLMVLEQGVIEGRKVFANIVKYIRMGASSNFGNMFSVLGASAFLPFLPMAPIQVLTNNLLYDFSQVPIPADAVDHEQVTRPRPWNIGEITRFILFIGPISSIFDYTTFFVMLWVFNCWDPAHASLFQTGWFVESLMTQTLVIHVIRTNKSPFLQSRARWSLTITTLSIMAFGMWLPYSPVASALGFTHLPRLYWPILLLTLIAYVSLTQVTKAWLLRRQWI